MSKVLIVLDYKDAEDFDDELYFLEEISNSVIIENVRKQIEEQL